MFIGMFPNLKRYERRMFKYMSAISRRGIEFISLLFVLLVALLQIGMSTGLSGVVIEQVWLMTSDGIQLNARVYRPMSSSGTMPSIVVCHGLASSLEMMQGAYSLEFAKRGFLVLAIDLRGHGSSGGNIGGLTLERGEYSPSREAIVNRSMFEEIMFSLFNETQLQTDVKAAVDYLLNVRTDVDHNRVAVLGHSMGGAAVLLESCSDRRVRSVVAVAPALSATSGMNTTSPRNLLLAVGSRDTLVSEGFVLRLFGRTTGGEKEVGRLYGNFSEGNARMMIVSPGADHVGEMFDPYIAKEAIAWVEASLGLSSNLPISLSPWISLLLPLAVSASLLSAFPAMLLVKWLRQLFGKPHEKPLLTNMRARKLVLIYLGSWAISAFLSLRFEHFLLDQLAPLMLADMLIEPYITSTIIILTTIIILRGTNQELNLNLGSRVTALRSAFFGGLGFLVAFVALNATFDWVFINLLPSARRLLLMPQLFSLLLPLSLLDEVLMRNFQSRLTLKLWLRIGVASVLSLSLKLLVIAFASFIFGAFIGLAAALLFISALYSAYLFERSGSVAGGAVFNALFLAWIIAAIFPFFHGYTNIFF